LGAERRGLKKRRRKKVTRTLENTQVPDKASEGGTLWEKKGECSKTRTITLKSWVKRRRDSQKGTLKMRETKAFCKNLSVRRGKARECFFPQKGRWATCLFRKILLSAECGRKNASGGAYLTHAASSKIAGGELEKSH